LTEKTIAYEALFKKPEGGGHIFPVDQADGTNARMLKFLKV
jgi:hypothetical protein